MKKKKLLTLVLALGLATSTAFIGCSKDTVENAGDKIKKRGIEDVGEGIKDVGEAGGGLWDKVTDDSMTYNEDDFKKEIEKKGYKLTEIEDTKSLLSVENDDYTINGDRLSIYEYDESAKSTLEGDLKSITDNGMMINGNKTSWTKAAHIYKKGRLVVIYDGNNESILTTLKDILGEPLL